MSDIISDRRRVGSRESGIPFSVGLRDFRNLAHKALVNPQRPEGALRARPATKDPLYLLSSPSSRSEVDVCTLASTSTCPFIIHVFISCFLLLDHLFTTFVLVTLSPMPYMLSRPEVSFPSLYSSGHLHHTSSLYTLIMPTQFALWHLTRLNAFTR